MWIAAYVIIISRCQIKKRKKKKEEEANHSGWNVFAKVYHLGRGKY